MLNPTPIELLRHVAETLRANVLAQLPPGPARDELQAGIAIIGRIARCLPTYRQFLHDDIADMAATLATLVDESADEARGAAVGPLLARAATLVSTVDPLDDLVALDVELRSVLAALTSPPHTGDDARLLPLLVRMTEREAALRLSPWER